MKSVEGDVSVSRKVYLSCSVSEPANEEGGVSEAHR